MLSLSLLSPHAGWWRATARPCSRLSRAGSQQCRAMTIASTYRTGGVGYKQRAVREELQRPHAPQRGLEPSPGGSDSSGGTPQGTLPAVIPEDVPAVTTAASEQEDPGAEDALAMETLMNELEKKGSLHRTTLTALEGTREWKDYDAHVTFELMLLRHRYQSTDTPMTAARRHQMQAHLRQKQKQVMEEHAARVAKAYVLSLTSEEADAMRQQFLRLDAAGVALKPPTAEETRVSEATMAEAFEAVKSALADPQQRERVVASAASVAGDRKEEGAGAGAPGRR